MMIRASRFNLYLAAALALAAGFGCEGLKSPEARTACLVRIHLESDPGADTNKCIVVQVPRHAPVELTVDRAPFLTEVDIKEAKIVEDPGGLSLRLQFNRKGSWILEEYSTGNRSRHFAIYAQFTEPNDVKHTTGRWLAAPKVTRRIPDGVLVFTPDANREELDKIVLGLNNVVKKLEKESFFPSE